MKNINQEIWTLLSHDLSLQKDLSRNLINIRALAKYMIETHGIEASLDAVISAIRRFKTERIFEKEDRRIMDIIRGSDIAIKNNIACITLNMKPSEFYDIFCNNIKIRKRLKLITGSHGIKLIVSKENADQIAEIFPKEKIRKIEKNLSEINVVVKDIAVRTKGVLARISNELSLHGINVAELIVEPPEFLIYVREGHVVEAHKALRNLI